MSSTLYELLYIIDAALEEEKIQQLSKEMRSVIEDGGGEIQKESNWGRRPLSFPINKKTEGYYINVDFSGDADLPGKLNEYVFTHAGILRHLTLKVSKAKLQQQKLDEERKQKELKAAQEAREEELAAARAAEEKAAAEQAATEQAAAEQAASEQPAENAEDSPAAAEEIPAAQTVQEPPAAGDEPTAEQPTAESDSQKEIKPE
ncbi:MAG: 30S ribosomal protein S6 [Candidatus Omnitrophica bacterium]|nr:30S ribosomal protein S6 [Candidatus Omnitrophota bacterium]